MTKFFKGFKHAFRGIEEGLRQRNLKVQFVCGALAVILGTYYQINAIEWMFLVICIFFVIVSEMLNSAIEETCNAMRDCLGAHYNATRIPRDIAAGAVLLSAICSVVVGLIIFFPKIFL